MTDSLLDGKSSVQFNAELAENPDILSHVSSTVPEIDFNYIPRNFRRSMSKMSLYAAAAVREALDSAGLKEAPQGTALFLGSSISSMETWIDFADKYNKKELDSVKTTVVFQVINHSPLANIAQAYDIKGPGLGNCLACATGLANVGMAYLAIIGGFIDKALCGGTDEYHPIVTACFSIMNAASNKYNDKPAQSSRPFDADRCGIVCSEGCGMLFVESLESALKRNANIYAEIVGFGTNTETKSISHPSAECITECMNLALNNAALHPEDVGLINAHATSTLAGDVEESKAIASVFGNNKPVNSLKGHMGHTMAASGSLELIATIEMMNRNNFAATLNLENIDPECAGVKHMQKNEELNINTFMKNSFALGGTNCSLIVRRYNK